MRPYNNVEERMAFIQKLFLDAATLARDTHTLEELIPLLDKQLPEYRSIAYEGASFELASTDLSREGKLTVWEEFKKASQKHPFHVDIGLGWAFAKSELSPTRYLQSLSQMQSSMVFDGIGYYYGLFKGRATLKNKIIPGIDEEARHGFDQGLGRRLWYMTKGNVLDVVDLLESFPVDRHQDLFRGIGIACGYVGGNERTNLLQLFQRAGEHGEQLQLGICLAAISRILSQTITPDIELACKISNGSFSDLEQYFAISTNNFHYLYNNGSTDHNWFAFLKSEFL
jgi:enediyne biosynthesis protein E3